MKKPASAKPLAKFSGHLLLVGAGKMGAAMLDGWLARGLNPKKVIVIEPQPAKSIKALTKRGLTLNPKGKAVEAAVIVIAVKPQTAPDAVPPLGAYAGKTTLVVSIMAGRTIGFLEKALPGAGAIVRAMPNTPAAIGRGISVAVPNAKVKAGQRKLATDLLAAIGKVEWVGDEALIDAVTGAVGLRPRLCVPAGRGDDASRHRRRTAGRSGGAAGARDGRRLRRIAAPVRSRPGHPAAKRNVARRHHRRGAGGADGAWRL